MKRLVCLFLMCLGALPAWAQAPEANFDLVGQLRVDPKDPAKVSVINAVRGGKLDFGPVAVRLELAKTSAELRRQIAEANGKWVGLRGAWVQPRVEKTPDTTREELGAVVFVPAALTVLEGGFHLVGQIIDYVHPDGSMAGVKHALVDRFGVVSPLEFEKDVNVAEIRAGRRYKAYGRYVHTGHKGLLLAFRVSRLEAIPDERYEADLSELGKRFFAALQGGKADDVLSCWASVNRAVKQRLTAPLPAGLSPARETPAREKRVAGGQGFPR